MRGGAGSGDEGRVGGCRDPGRPAWAPLIPSRGLIVQQGLPWSLDRHRLVPPAPVSALRAVSVPAVPAAEGQGNGHGRSRGGPVLLSGQPQPASPVVLPPRSPTCVSPHAHPPVLAGAAGVARLVGVARVLGPSFVLYVTMDLSQCPLVWRTVSLLT